MRTHNRNLENFDQISFSYFDVFSADLSALSVDAFVHL
jgi:hypothetical protein